LANDGLVVAAVREELGDLEGEVIGIGAVQAAIGMTRQLLQSRPARVVLVGSCGAYTDHHPIGTAIVGEVLGWGTAGMIAKLAYGVGDTAPITVDPTVSAAFDAPRARVWTTPAITTDPEVVARFAERADVEHLETWGVACACAAFGVPFVPVLGVANRVGPDAHAEWLAHRAEAEEAARSVVRAGLGR